MVFILSHNFAPQLQICFIKLQRVNVGIRLQMVLTCRTVLPFINCILYSGKASHLNRCYMALFLFIQDII